MRVCRATAQYRSRRTDPAPLVAKLRELATQRPRWGYRRLHILLRREGIDVNHKRVYRLYRAEGLAVRRKHRKRLASALRTVLPPPAAPNERWSMDFVSDALMNGTRIRAFNVVDDFTRECLAIEVDTSIPGLRATRVLERIAATRPLPKYLICDNGPEFTGSAFDAWAHRRGVRVHFIRPGKPVENAYAESFNGKLARRVPQRELVRHDGGREVEDRGVEARLQPGPAALRAGQPHAVRVCSASQLGCSGCGLELGVRSRVVPGTAPVDGAAGTGLRDPSMPMVAVAWSSQRQTSNVYVS